MGPLGMQSVCPMRRLLMLSPGFAVVIAETVVRKRCAIAHKESPGRTVYEFDPAGHKIIDITAF